MPTTAVSTWELQGNQLNPLYGADAPEEAISLKASTSYPAGTLVGEVTATPGTYGPYAHGNSDGTQKPSHIVRYTCTTDASGNITKPGEWGVTAKSIDAFFAGTFRTQELVGLDATNIADWPGAHIIQGSATQGVVRFP